MMIGALHCRRCCLETPISGVFLFRNAVLRPALAALTVGMKRQHPAARIAAASVRMNNRISFSSRLHRSLVWPIRANLQ
jgi:hypothetical protein